MRFFNTSFLEPQKPDFTQKRPPRAKTMTRQDHKVRKKFYLIFAKLHNSQSFGKKKFWPLKAKKAKICLRNVARPIDCENKKNLVSVYSVYHYR